MKELILIDDEISKRVDRLREISQELRFKEICQFKLNKNISEIPWDDLCHSGIYLIEIKNDNKYTTFNSWVENFKKEWENEDYLRKFVPNLKKKRIVKHSELNDWIPIYLGKAKKINERLNVHIYHDLEKTTFALKLFARKNLQNDIFKLSVIELKLKNYDSIAPIIESSLRDRINPLIGKQ